MQREEHACLWMHSCSPCCWALLTSFELLTSEQRAAVQEQHQGCCSKECASSSPRFLRPMAQGVFGRWADLLVASTEAHATETAERMRAGRTSSKARCACVTNARLVQRVYGCWACSGLAPRHLRPSMPRCACRAHQRQVSTLAPR